MFFYKQLAFAAVFAMMLAQGHAVPVVTERQVCTPGSDAEDVAIGAEAQTGGRRVVRRVTTDHDYGDDQCGPGHGVLW
ncbi:uncharacterized protein C8Q71DRAFT_147223 [Rhodofomes roseus]|uniref:Secreted protein n=1 Tax=Rhodofomes roseus TaxID=34475 RepID=A0ABQ8KAN0_9APHY|nr:uncharacterized protein C8Q71DRAFT_147223 [Rhodofomes roseus]KAH9834555.1 hypothetical protein C8Q71DRAFT_147223 [Rhodofomes roseus]